MTLRLIKNIARLFNHRNAVITKSAATSDVAMAGNPFLEYICDRYDDVTAQSVYWAFEKIGVPLPAADDQYFHGNGSEIVFLNKYGVTLRLEQKTSRDANWGKNKRVSSSPWIAQAVGSLELKGGLALEICLGCPVNDAQSNVDFLKRELLTQNIIFYDTQIDNVGLFPSRLPEFPNGIPIVIDRGAVGAMGVDLIGVNSSLNQSVLEKVIAAQEAVYQPLCHAFSEALPDVNGPADSVKMKAFWHACAAFKDAGLIVDGWNTEKPAEEPAVHDRKSQLIKSARNYQRLQA